MKKALSEAIAQIQKQGIKPQSKTKFLLKNAGIWVAFIFVVVLGAISFATMMAIVNGLDWDLYRVTHQNSLAYGFSLFPFVWLVIIALLFLLAFFELRKTQRGYKFGLGKILLLSVGGILAAGIVMFYWGIGNNFHAAMMQDFPYYAQHMITKETQWMQPEKGFLAGTITHVSSNGFDLQDLSGKKWSVQIDQNTVVRPLANMSENQMIKMIGSKVSGNIFKANEIRPWAGMGMMNGKGQNLQRGSMMNGRQMMR